MKIIDKLSVAITVRECIRGNEEGFDCYPMDFQGKGCDAWWCWTTWRLFWFIPIRIVVAVTPKKGEVGWYMGRFL